MSFLKRLSFTFLFFAICACTGDKTDFESLKKMSVSKVRTERNYIKDAHDRYVMFNGVNVGGSTKIPYTFEPDLSYIGRPFPEAEIDKHYKQIKDMGFNSIRLLWIWEAVEHKGWRQYDTAYLDYFEKLIAKAKEHGIYVLVNLHENLFSRYLYVRYNENTDDLYFSYCRNNETQKVDFTKKCTSDPKELTERNNKAIREKDDKWIPFVQCSAAETCSKPLKSEKNGLVDSILSTFPKFDTTKNPDGTENKNFDPLKSASSANKVNNFFSDRVQGDGAPYWAVKACLPNKVIPKNVEPELGKVVQPSSEVCDDSDVDCKDEKIVNRSWGVFRALAYFQENEVQINRLLDLLSGGAPGPEADAEAIKKTIIRSRTAGLFPKDAELKDGEAIKKMTDMMPWTFWGVNAVLSMDVQRCYATLFGGDRLFPYEKVTRPDGKVVSRQEFLLDAYTKSWVEIAKRSAKYDNVVGYDLMNEPIGILLILGLFSAMVENGSTDAASNLLTELLGNELGKTLSDVVFGLRILPQMDPSPKLIDNPTDEQQKQYDEDYKKWQQARDKKLEQWSLNGASFTDMLGTLVGFDKNYIQPVYERIGKAIQDVDPKAVIWIEESTGLNLLLGESFNGTYEQNMTKPEGIDQVVLAPHWYPDIYPNLGFNMTPREFTVEEWIYRDWVEPIESKAKRAQYSLGNVPVVYGEFGTYYNYNGIDKAIKNNYLISEHILDNYYEAFEHLNYSRMLWCYTADNSKLYGDKWNHEDFSILDFNQESRAERIYNRPFGRALSGKPHKTHFYSDLHYFDPDKGEPNAEREFLLEFKSKETNAPTEIYVPRIQYPDGFYVWLSDGYTIFDSKERVLFYYPSVDNPEHMHKVVIRPPRENGPNIRDNKDWDYFYSGAQVIERGGK